MCACMCVFVWEWQSFIHTLSSHYMVKNTCTEQQEHQEQQTNGSRVVVGTVDSPAGTSNSSSRSVESGTAE